MTRDLGIPVNANNRPARLLIVGIGWLVVATFAAWEIYESRSLALVFQLLLMVSTYGAYQTFNRFRDTSGQYKLSASHPFFYSPVAVYCALFLHWAIGGILSQAIYDTVLMHDYYALTTLRMLGGRVKPGVQNMDALRHTFLQLIANNKPFTADRFLEVGMDPDLIYAHEPTTRSLLAEAVFFGRSAIVQSLLKHGADPNPKGSDPPLLLAVQSENRQIVQLLLQHGAKISLTSEERAMIAPEMLALLRNSGAIH